LKKIKKSRPKKEKDLKKKKTGLRTHVVRARRVSRVYALRHAISG